MGNSSTEPPPTTFQQRFRGYVCIVVAVCLTLYVLIEVNFSLLAPLKELAVFGSAGVILALLKFPMIGRWRNTTALHVLDWVLVVLAIVCCGYLLYHGTQLGQRAALYSPLDLAVGAVGLLLVWESTRRAIGWAVPCLSVIFLVYAHESIAQQLPDWMFPHRGQDWQSLIGQLYLRTEGVFGTALGVMFKYVFLFVLFGALLEASGSTRYIIEMALRLFGQRSGGPAKVSIVASGLMGSLSGSAVANVATTGVFTIPLMRSVGFKPHIAAGIEAAASSGGALAPPVMGAGAYMMLEIINRQPPVTYLEVMKAALIPAILYYLSLFMLVHFQAKRNDAQDDANRKDHSLDTDAEISRTLSSSTLASGQSESEQPPPVRWYGFEGATFLGALALLLAFLLWGASPFRAVSYAMAFVQLMIILSPQTKASKLARLAAVGVWSSLIVCAKFCFPNLISYWPEALIWSMAGSWLVALCWSTWRSKVLDCLRSATNGGVPLIVAAACVGIVIGLVSRTGIGTGVPQAIIPLAGNNLFLGLLAIMVCSLILGMGLPSAVSYLLLATIIGPVFADPTLGVPILAAHLFIFYFGMMAMVTPPVALAGYAAASIAGTGVMQASWAAFRFSLVGFTLPYMFVYRPALCMIGDDGGAPLVLDVVVAVTAAVLGILSLAGALSGYLFHPLKWPLRTLLFLAAACALFPDRFDLLGRYLQLFDIIGALLLASVAVISYSASKREHSAT
ncbi:MAG: TRAP transporter fused permease subunit [Pirellulaceae bacterium]|nr:TRAP transporter fused permease subunit [Pirellulaceae bacterium]